MKILLLIVSAIFILFICLWIYLTVKYPRIDKELRLIAWIYTLFNNFDSEESLRKYASRPNKPIPTLGKGKAERIEISEITIDGEDGNPIPLVIYKPKNIKPNATGLLWIHGGGFAYGAPRRDERFFTPLVMETNTVAVVPDYRLSCNNPYPAAFHDCRSALLWLCGHAGELGINENQIFIGACSAGCAISAALTIYMRNIHRTDIAYQILIYPSLDDRMNTPSMVGNKELIWDEKKNTLVWQLYLGDLYGTDDVPVYAAPARETDLTGLPATYSFVGTLDPLYDETIDYIQRLRKCGVEAKCDIYEAACHGFDAIPSKLAKKAKAKLLSEYKYATENYYSARNHV